MQKLRDGNVDLCTDNILLSRLFSSSLADISCGLYYPSLNYSFWNKAYHLAGSTAFTLKTWSKNSVYSILFKRPGSTRGIVLTVQHTGIWSPVDSTRSRLPDELWNSKTEPIDGNENNSATFPSIMTKANMQIGGNRVINIFVDIWWSFSSRLKDGCVENLVAERIWIHVYFLISY